MDEQCCGQKTYEQLLEGFQSQIDSLRELEAANAALTQQLQEAQGENERLKGLITSSDTVRANACKSVERISAEAAAHLAMLRHVFDVVSENTSENDPANPLYDLVDEIDGYVATCAGAAFLTRYEAMEAVVEAAKGVIKSTRVEGAGILPTLIKLEKVIELKAALAKLAALGGE